MLQQPRPLPCPTPRGRAAGTRKTTAGVLDPVPVATWPARSRIVRVSGPGRAAGRSARLPAIGVAAAPAPIVAPPAAAVITLRRREGLGEFHVGIAAFIASLP